MNKEVETRTLKEKILDVHEKIENELDFMIDVDTQFTNQYFDILDNVDKRFIFLEQENNQKIITLFETEEDGLLYLKELETLLFLIRKYGLKIDLKKLKLLLRRKRSKKEVIYLFSLLQQKKEFFLKNKEEFKIEDQNEIENTISIIEKIVENKKEEDFVEIDDKDSKVVNSPLGNMIGITLAVPTIIAKGLFPEDKLKTNDLTDKKVIENYFNKESVDYYHMKKDFIDNNINRKNNVLNDFLAFDLSSKVKTNKLSDGELNNEDNKNVEEEHQSINQFSNNTSSVEDEKLVTEENQEEKENKLDNTIKIVGTTLAGAGLVASSSILAPVAFKTAVAVGATKMLLEDDTLEEKENLEEELDDLKQELETKEEELNTTQEELKEAQAEKEEYQELITTLEEAKDTDIKEVQEDPELNSEQARTERYEAMRISFEQMRQEEQFRLRTEQINKSRQEQRENQRHEEQRRNDNNRRNQPRQRSPFANFMRRVGATTFLFAMNIAVATAIARPPIMPGPVRRLRP